MNRLTVLMLVALVAFAPVSFAIAGESSADSTAVATAASPSDWFNALSLRTGGLIDIDRNHDREFLTVPLGGYKLLTFEAGLGADFITHEGLQEFVPEAAVFAVTYHVGDLQNLGIRADWGKFIALNVGPAFWYEFETEETGWALLVSVLDLGR